jgi:lipoate-protein ligase A
VSRWQIERHRGSARAFHGRAIDDVAEPTVWVFEVDATAVALGSTQPIEDVDLGLAAELGIDVFHRRSGGGAVLLQPDSSLWIDVVLPASDHRWTEDVSVAPLWLGQLWANALRGVGADAVTVHIGPMQANPMSSVICFAGIGPGEVLRGGKVVGISQRRTRTVARFQTVALLGWDWSLHQRLLAPGIDRVGGGGGEPLVSPQVDLTLGPLLEAFLIELEMN